MATAGIVGAKGKGLIEHIVLSSDLEVIEPPTVLERFDDSGKELTDHDGVGLALAALDTLGKTR